MKKKALVLMSGGLDSTLAARWALEQENLEVEAVHFKTPFCSCPGPKKIDEATTTPRGKVADIKTKYIFMGPEYLEMIKNPKHGYGRNMNPCIDCRIMMFQKAADHMQESGADLLITGEVLGSRSMSQRRETMHTIENEAGLKGKVLRPLSGKRMPPTEVEKQGVVERDAMLDIQGRSRKPQMEMARQRGIENYPTPAGGCLLTDPGFSRKLKDLFSHHPDCDVYDVNLLKVGRHLRLSSRLKLVVGRDKKENDKLGLLSRPKDHRIQVWDTLGALCLARGEVTEGDEPVIAGIAAFYSKSRNRDSAEVSWLRVPSRERRKVLPRSLTKEKIDTFRI